VRAGAFAYCFLVLALHGWERHLSWGYWVALLSWLVLPHVQYLYAIRARDPRQAEVRNIFADSLTFGIWTGAQLRRDLAVGRERDTPVPPPTVNMEQHA
jgi:hypothetical protein